ncbi:hypothetical protein HGRIS_005979 [Hohenbuehelia grisea]|uniref:Uncharacterized protein n=1 Tax=Hohenbuehelia grisea TaxID=104357 RepID=A0ABR3JZC8_9AGAR
MGKSAKLHKRGHKKAALKGTSGAGSAKSSGGATGSHVQVQAAKKKATLKDKTKSKPSKTGSSDGVLGGADYVSLLMGGRRKAREEAEKLPRDE